MERKCEQFLNEFSTNFASEYCPNCEEYIEMVWCFEERGFKAYCPVCGEKLMLCDACQHRNPDDTYMDDCDYDSETDTCRFCK